MYLGAFLSSKVRWLGLINWLISLASGLLLSRTNIFLLTEPLEREALGKDSLLSINFCNWSKSLLVTNTESFNTFNSVFFCTGSCFCSWFWVCCTCCVVCTCCTDWTCCLEPELIMLFNLTSSL